jgi:TolB protein
MKKGLKYRVQEFKGSRVRGNGYLFVIFSLFLIFYFHLNVRAERVYLDITSPTIQKMPIAIQDFVGLKNVSEIIRDDLSFTGLFDCLDESASIERPDQPFNHANWRGLGVSIVVKGKVVQTNKGLNVAFSVYDVSENSEILKKEYSGTNELLRPIAHSISNDIYKIVTGQEGIFRSKIAFVGEIKDKKKEIYIMDWDGKRISPTGVKGDIILAPRWSKDKGKLLFSVQRRRLWSISLIDLNDYKEKILFSSDGLSLAGNFLPDNRRFVFSSLKDGRSIIFISDTKDEEIERIMSSRWIDVSPSISPDGREVLFTSNRSGSPQIYVSDIRGGGIRRLTYEGSYNTSAVWSPKGDRVAFVRMISGKNQIFIMKPDGSGVVQLTDKGSNEDPSFSPDGRYIAFTSDRDGSKGIYLMKINGLDQKRITPKELPAYGPSWSP